MFYLKIRAFIFIDIACRATIWAYLNPLIVDTVFCWQIRTFDLLCFGCTFCNHRTRASSHCIISFDTEFICCTIFQIAHCQRSCIFDIFCRPVCDTFLTIVYGITGCIFCFAPTKAQCCVHRFYL